MSENKPWAPNLDKSTEFRDHTNPAVGDDSPLHVPDATEDTSPLRGSKDLSDEDSLEDVIAESFEPEVPSDGTGKPLPGTVRPEKLRP